MMSRRLSLVLIALAALLCASQAGAQTVFRHGGGDDSDNDVVVLHELGIVAGAPGESGDLEVLILLPDADPGLELQQGDLLLMIDGARVRDVAGLRKSYQAVEVGQTIKVGFRRGDERFLRSFEKAEEEQGAVRMVMMGGPGDAMGDLQPLTEFGVILAEKNGAVVVAMKLPMDEAAFEEDDVVKSINGTDVGSLADFRQIYEEVKIGSNLAMVVERDGAAIDSTRPKSEATGKIRVRKSH